MTRADTTHSVDCEEGFILILPNNIGPVYVLSCITCFEVVNQPVTARVANGCSYND